MASLEYMESIDRISLRAALHVAATYARASVCEEEGDLGACEVSELAADPCARPAQGPPASTQTS